MNYIKTGKVQNTHGLDGKVMIKYAPQLEKVFQDSAHIFIELHPESYIPFFITEKEFLSAGEVLVKLEEVDQPEQAKELLDKAVFVEADRLPATAVDTERYEDLEGFVVFDEMIGRLGLIETIFETPGQLIAVLYYKGKEVLIPLIPRTVAEIDAAEKTVTVHLPEGLIDIYLE